MSSFTKAKLADIAEAEAKKHLVWSPGSEADKYRKKFFNVFGTGKWSWCAAFQTWCAEQAGLAMPENCPSHFGYTFALVEAWQQWAIQMGFYHKNDGHYVPTRGCQVIFDWSKKSLSEPDTDWDNHIGLYLHMDGAAYVCAEGNTSNQTNIKERSGINIEGFIDIPDGYSFDGVAPQVPVFPGYAPDAVKALQLAVNGMGSSFSLGVDGVLGPKTKAALKILSA